MSFILQISALLSLHVSRIHFTIEGTPEISHRFVHDIVMIVIVDLKVILEGRTCQILVVFHVEINKVP